MASLPMQYRPLGRTGLNVSLASLGTGGDSRLGQSTHGRREESHRVVRRALELGMNLIDTAPVYMESEQLLGEALRGIPRDTYYLSTKVTPRRQNTLVSEDDVITSCEASLRRMATDYVDIFLFHGITRAEYPGIRDHLWPAARKLQEQGKVRFIGVTEPMPGPRVSRLSGDGPPLSDSPDAVPDGGDGHGMVVQAARDGIWDAVMLKYGLLDQSAAHAALPAAQAAQLGVLDMSAVRGPLVRPEELAKLISEWKELGLLEGDVLPDEDPLGFLVHDGVEALIEAGYRFVAQHPAISTIPIGTGSVSHLEESVAAVLAGPLPFADYARLQELFGSLAAERP